MDLKSAKEVVAPDELCDVLEGLIHLGMIQSFEFTAASVRISGAKDSLEPLFVHSELTSQQPELKIRGRRDSKKRKRHDS